MALIYLVGSSSETRQATVSEMLLLDDYEGGERVMTVY